MLLDALPTRSNERLGTAITLRRGSDLSLELNMTEPDRCAMVDEKPVETWRSCENGTRASGTPRACSFYPNDDTRPPSEDTTTSTSRVDMDAMRHRLKRQDYPSKAMRGPATHGAARGQFLRSVSRCVRGSWTRNLHFQHRGVSY